MTKNIKLYQDLTEKQLDAFLKANGTSIQQQKLVEIKSTEDDLFGDFIVVKGYKFKKIYGNYQCLQTPTQKHTKTELKWPKAKNDYYKK